MKITTHEINGRLIWVQYGETECPSGAIIYRMGENGTGISNLWRYSRLSHKAKPAEGEPSSTITPEEATQAIRERLADQKKRKRNAMRRDKNAVIRELCGTSAAEARHDGSI